MKKEDIWSIAIFAAIGLIITAIVYNSKKISLPAQIKQPKTEEQLEINQQPRIFSKKELDTLTSTQVIVLYTEHEIAISQHWLTMPEGATMKDAVVDWILTVQNRFIDKSSSNNLNSSDEQQPKEKSILVDRSAQDSQRDTAEIQSQNNQD